MKYFLKGFFWCLSTVIIGAIVGSVISYGLDKYPKICWILFLIGICVFSGFMNYKINKSKDAEQ